jgi:hypothetical protein
MINLVAIDSFEKAKITSNIEHRCFMCRVELTKETASQEHIYPKWVLKKYNMFDHVLTLPNKTKIPYRQWKVQCCKNCNGIRMSEIESQIKKSISEGIKSVKSLDEELIVWWLLKLYYAKIYKEAQLKKDISKPEFGQLIESELFERYNDIFFYLSELYKGFKFRDPKPYDLYIFKTTEEATFDYIDDTISHTVYIRLDSIIFICCFNSFGIHQLQFQQSLDILYKLPKIHYYQALEIYAKITYFNRLYRKDVEHSYFIDKSGVNITTEILDISEFEKFDFNNCNSLIKEVFELRGLKIASEFVPNRIMTIIVKSNGEPYTFDEIENNYY